MNVLRFFLKMIFLPKLMLAIASSWIIFISAPDLWKLSYDIDLCYLAFLFVLLSGIIIRYLYNEIGQLDSRMNYNTKLKRTGGIFLLSLLYSVIIGVIFSISLSTRIIERADKDFKKIYDESVYDNFSKQLTKQFNDTIVSLRMSVPLFSCCDNDNDTIELCQYQNVIDNPEEPDYNFILNIDTALTMKRIIKRDSLRKVHILNNEIVLNKGDTVFFEKSNSIGRLNLQRKNLIDSLKSKFYIYNVCGFDIFLRSFVLFSIISLFIGIFINMYLESRRIIEP